MISWSSLYDIDSKMILSIDVILSYLSNPYLTNSGKRDVVFIAVIIVVADFGL